LGGKILGLKVLAKRSAIFRFLPELFLCQPKKLVEKLHILPSPIFLFCQKFEITILAKILNIVAKFRKDSIFRAEILANLSLKY